MYCNLEVWRTKHSVQLNILLLSSNASLNIVRLTSLIMGLLYLWMVGRQWRNTEIRTN